MCVCVFQATIRASVLLVTRFQPHVTHLRSKLFFLPPSQSSARHAVLSAQHGMFAASDHPSTSAAATEGLVAPGEQLGRSSELVAGEGCFVWGDHVHAGRAGVRQLDSSQPRPVMTVLGEDAANKASIVPVVGDIVTCKIVRINPRQAQLEILCVGSTALREPVGGIIRREDVRDYERDQVAIYKSFRPGDVVLGRVLSFGSMVKVASCVLLP